MSPGIPLLYCRSHGQPSWLQATLADLEEKMKMLSSSLPEDDSSDSFAKRAENYYRKRPQLLNLLKDLYNGYLSLADRYSQSLIKHHNHSSPIPTVHSEIDDDEEHNQIDSDAESSLSYQQQPTLSHISSEMSPESDTLIAELVTKTIDSEFLIQELGILENYQAESSRKIELQKSLLEVLESERLILLNENARLGYKVTTLIEENKELAKESIFMKRKAGELARCVLKMRDDHRVCLLSKKIEDLQGQINGLQKKNKDYYEQLVEKGGGEKKDLALGVCLEMENLKREMEDEEAVMRKGSGRWRSVKWWERVKKFDLFQCGPHL